MTAITPGTTLAATNAMRGDQETFTRAQVAYLIDLAYRSGIAQGHSYDVAEMLATWAEDRPAPPTREDRIAAEIAAMTERTKQLHRERGWPEDYEYTGGPVDWNTGLAIRPASEQPFPAPPTYFPRDESRVRPKFPTLEEQSAWLSAEDVAFCRRYAREHYGPTGGRA